MNRSFSLIVISLLVVGCASKLQEAPESSEVLDDALPETTEVRAEWAAPADDTGQVDNGWLATFHDAQLDVERSKPMLRRLFATVSKKPS